MNELLSTYWLPVSAMAVGVVLFLLAPWIAGAARDPDRSSLQVLMLRVVIAAFVLLQVADIALHQAVEPYYNRLLLKSSLTILTLVTGLAAFNLSSRLFDAKFGSTRTIDGQEVAIASYHSRMASLLFLCVLFVALVYALIEIWDMESLLEKTGFVGLIAVFLVLTSSIWLPDIFAGLVLLGSSMMEEGDTITLRADNRLFIIHRLTPFYAILLDVDDNHRVLIKNAELLRMQIENLSKRASVEGVRRAIEFKLGYPRGRRAQPGEDDLFTLVDRMVARSFERARSAPNLHINVNVPFEWALVEAGDYALKFVLYYHLQALPESKLTQKIRSYLRSTRNSIVRVIFEEASALGLDLSTPSLLKIDAAAQDSAATGLQHTTA